jgi:hypothetical protein
MIYLIEQYVDDEGRQVFLKRPQVKSLDEKAKPLYMGTFTVTVPTPFGPQEAQIQFDFPEDHGLEKCFEEFDKLAEAEYERLLEEAREKSAERKIITPDEMGGIVMP